MRDAAGNQQRILIADDQEANVRLLEAMLRRGGYTQLATTTNSSDIVRLYGEVKPDLVVLDLHMPDPDGFAVMEQLRPLVPAGTYLPILVVTADITPEAKRRALLAGARDFLVKPLEQTEVLLRVGNLLETRQLHLQLYATAERRLRHMRALHEIDEAIIGSTDLRVILHVFLERAAAELRVDATAVLLYNRQAQLLECAARHGFRTAALQHTHLRLGDGFAGRAAAERRLVSNPRMAADPGDLRRAPLLPAEGFSAYYAVPLVAKGTITGVLELFHRSRLTPDDEWFEFLDGLAKGAAVAIENAVLFEDLQRSHGELALAYDTTLEGWCRTLELRDGDTEGHTRRVTDACLQLARMLGVAGEELAHIRRGALLHDIGKMAVPDRILLKPGPLTADESNVMRRHPLIAYELLAPIPYLRPALDIPYCHHERWDGTGYPRGLAGEQIPLAARIFAVADVWDALRTDRGYREAWTDEQARAYIRDHAGTLFDPRVVDVFLEMSAGAA